MLLTLLCKMTLISIYYSNVDTHTHNHPNLLISNVSSAHYAHNYTRVLNETGVEIYSLGKIILY